MPFHINFARNNGFDRTHNRVDVILMIISSKFKKEKHRKIRLLKLPFFKVVIL